MRDRPYRFKDSTKVIDGENDLGMRRVRRPKRFFDGMNGKAPSWDLPLSMVDLSRILHKVRGAYTRRDPL